MTKTANLTTLQPGLFSILYEVFNEDLRAVAEFLNWVCCNRNQVHVSLATGADDWGGTGSPQVLNILFSNTAGWVTRFYFVIVIPPEAQSIQFGARVTIGGASNTCRVRVTVGAAAAVECQFSGSSDITNANHANEFTGSVSTGSTGTADQVVTVELNHTTGSALCSLIYFRLEEAVGTVTSIPDPVDS